MFTLPFYRVWLALLLLAGSHSSYAADNYLQRDEVRSFIAELSQQTGLNRHRLTGLFSVVKRQQGILDAISRPAERTLEWRQYRPIFIKQARVEQGRQFLETHRELLARATQTYGVPGSIITAIIGVETFYGRITGKHRILDALATLAFDYPPRSGFFKQELAEFLVLGEAEGWDLLEKQGSYAGAMGVPQFISSSYRQYAVDFDGDGKRDLFDSMADVIGSVANYLSIHGWVRGAAVADRWIMAGEVPAAVQALERRSLQPTVADQTVSSLGFTSKNLSAATTNRALLSVMTLAGQHAEEVWVGYRNFYAITRYNHSRLYAMAVHQLAEAIVNANDSTLG